jgi:hypothetical protein
MDDETMDGAREMNGIGGGWEPSPYAMGWKMMGGTGTSTARQPGAIQCSGK